MAESNLSPPLLIEIGLAHCQKFEVTSAVVNKQDQNSMKMAITMFTVFS